MKPELLPDTEAFIELPPSMDFRKPGAVEPWDSRGRFYSGEQWSELDFRRMGETSAPRLKINMLMPTPSEIEAGAIPDLPILNIRPVDSESC